MQINFLHIGKSIPRYVYACVLGAFAIRIMGIWYGLPLQLNIDEPTLVSSTLSLKTSLNPGHFDWPHLYFYINLIFYLGFSLLRKLLSVFIELPNVYNTHVPFFIISRTLSAFFGAITIIPIYFLAKKIFSEKVAKVSALILVFLPIHVYEAHFGKIDTTHTFFAALAALSIWKVYETDKIRDYLITGLAIGITTSIKYNGAFLFVPLLVAYILRDPKFISFANMDRIKKLVSSGLVSIFAFFVGTPFALIDYSTFLSDKRAVGVLWQFKNVGKVSWEQYPIELYNTFVLMYQNHLGLFLWMIFLLLIVLFLFFNKRTPQYIFLLTPVILLSFYISSFGRSPGHYFMLLIPFYIPALAAFIVEIYNKFFVKLKGGIVLLLLVILIPSVLMSLRHSYLLSKTDTRNFAYNWVKANLDENKDFLYVNGEELKSIPFKKNETEKIKKVDRSNVRRPGPFYIVIGVEGITKESITEGKRDPDNLNGNSEPILEDAELVFYQDDIGRLGPPIYIFKVNSVRQD